MKNLAFEEVQLIEEIYDYEKPHKEYYRISKDMVESGIVDATLAKLLNEEFNLYLKEKVKLNPIGSYTDKTNFKCEYYQKEGLLYQYGYNDNNEVCIILICKKKNEFKYQN